MMGERKRALEQFYAGQEGVTAGRLEGIAIAGGVAHMIMDRAKGERAEYVENGGDPYMHDAKIEIISEVVDEIEARLLARQTKDNGNG